MLTVLIAGGGTGGHVFPMVAVGEAVEALERDARVVYVGTPRGIEGRVVGELGKEIVLMNVAPLRGGGVRGFVKGVARAAGSIPEAREIVRRIAPDVVLSVGGYAAGPVSLAARTLGAPITMLEPNSVMGLSNRLLAPFVERAYVAFPETERFLRPSVTRRVGVPLRRAFAPRPYTPPSSVTRVLVLGGSQGAQALNETVPRALAQAVRAGARLEIVHQTGRERDPAVRALYEELGMADKAKVVPFIDDMAGELERACVIVGRAGASSLAEICAVGRASILIPYPFAADDHQRHNAGSLERAGAAITITQEGATPARIADEVSRLAADAERRARMASAALALGQPEAARAVAEDLIDIVRARHRAREAS